jgi:2-keto-4-pentenoate hydratase
MENSAAFKVKGGKLIKVKLIKENDLIISVQIFGDFFIHPEESLELLEGSLRNVTLEEAVKKIYEFFRGVELIGATSDDFVNTIKLAYYK